MGLLNFIYEMCDKKKFKKRWAKEAIFNAMIARMYGSEKRREIRYYWCSECNSYHLTSKPYVRQMISNRPLGIREREQDRFSHQEARV